jgi:hypothetical protein
VTDDRGYTTRDVTMLSPADLLEEALQAADSAGHYAMTDYAYSSLHTEAIQRRDQCFAELRRRLEAGHALAVAINEALEKLEEFDPGISDYFNEIAEGLRASLSPFQETIK